MAWLRFHRARGGRGLTHPYRRVVVDKLRLCRATALCRACTAARWVRSAQVGCAHSPYPTPKAPTSPGSTHLDALDPSRSEPAAGSHDSQRSRLDLGAVAACGLRHHHPDRSPTRGNFRWGPLSSANSQLRLTPLALPAGDRTQVAPTICCIPLMARAMTRRRTSESPRRSCNSSRAVRRAGRLLSPRPGRRPQGGAARPLSRRLAVTRRGWNCDRGPAGGARRSTSRYQPPLGAVGALAGRAMDRGPEARPCGQQSCSRPPPGDGVFLHQRGGGGDRPGLVVHPLPALLARVLGRRAGVVEAFGHLGDRVEVLDWGRAGPNQMLTLKALRVLAGAGHLSWAAPRSESDAG